MKRVTLLLVVGLGLVAELTSLARPDMGFLLYAAGRALDGASLYGDIVEINPPLIIALNLPAIFLARGLGLTDFLVYRLLVALLLLVSIALCRHVIDRFSPADPGRRDVLVLLVAFVLFLLPGVDFGQREHLLLALALPYLLVCVARDRGRLVPTRLAAGAGVLAGVGLALKPHFLLLWAAMELYLHRRRHPGGKRPAPESLSIAGFMLFYGLCIAMVTPEYFQLVARLGPMYAGYLHDPFLHVLITAPGTTVAFLSLLTFIALARQSRDRPLWNVLAAAVAACFLAGSLQQKGWTYHFYPATACGLLLLGAAVIDVARPIGNRVQRIYLAAAGAAVGTSVIWAALLAGGRAIGVDPVQERDRRALEELRTAVLQHGGGGRLFVFSYTIGSSFPLVNYAGVELASRFPHLWILEAAYQDQLEGSAPLRYRTAGEMGEAERYLNDAVHEDLSRNDPSLLLVLRHARDVQANSLRRLDYIGYFSRDLRIARDLARYRLAGDVGEYRVYTRADARASGAGELPVSRPGTLDIIRNEVRGPQVILLDRSFVICALVFLVLAALILVREGRRARPPSGAAASGAQPATDGLRVADGDSGRG